MLLRARFVLPVARPPIENGAVLISGRRIVDVGSWPDLSRRRAPVLDLGDVILMPGLVNAHCHLDYTHMAGQFPPPKSFSDWLKQITETKAGWDLADYAKSWRTGAAMLLRTGTTTVGDIEAVPELLPEVWARTPLRVISFLEMIGITARRTPKEVLAETLQLLDQLEARPGMCRGENGLPPRLVGLSPHAPYSTLPELLRLTGAAARRRGWRVVTHVAESQLEYDMFCRRRGAMFRWLRRASRDMSDCGRGTPVQHLERCGILGRRFVAVHANYLGRHDPEILAKHKVSVVHCPRSHYYFSHEPFPLRRLLRAGVNVALGTDSLASVYVSRKQAVELSMFDEMRALGRAERSIAPAELLRMATANSAKALGLSGQVGELKPNAMADVVCLPFRGRAGEVYEAVLGFHGKVRGTMIAGHWALRPNGA